MLFTLFDFAVDGSEVKESASQCRRHGFGPWVRKTEEEGLLPFPPPGGNLLATYSSILAWEILWLEEPKGLQCTGLQRVRHDSATTTKCIRHEKV